MPRVLIAGHFNPELPAPLGFSDFVGGTGLQNYRESLQQFEQGFRSAAPGWESSILPFGPGPIFADVLGDRGAVSLSTGGEELLIPEEAASPLLIEMGHDRGHDWGIRVREAFDAEDLRRRDVVVAYSTSRPLYGAGGTSNTDQQLRLRTDIVEPKGWRQALTQLAEEPAGSLQFGGQDDRLDPGTRPGSGAGGGAAAWLMALGARAFPTGEVLAHYLDAERLIAEADLVIIATPHWHSPDLTDAVPLVLTGLGSPATPRVGVGLASSLSAHEQAQWGIQGLHLLGKKDGLEELGRRVGQTWGRV